MAKSPTNRPERPPAVGSQVGTRWQAEDLEAIDQWRREQPDIPHRAEAIRRLVRMGLATAKRRK